MATIVVVRVPFHIENRSVIIHGEVNGSPCEFILDTGDAVGPVFNASDTERLGLPALAQESVSGAGGASAVYETEANVKLGSVTYPRETGAIDESLGGPSLLGLPFFLAKADALSFDFVTGELIMVLKSTSN